MPVTVTVTGTDPSHDLSLTDGSTTVGLMYAGGPRILQEIPLSPPAQQIDIEQKDFVGGLGNKRYSDNPTGFFDGQNLWSSTPGSLLPAPQWRFATGLRTTEVTDESMPADND